MPLLNVHDQTMYYEIIGADAPSAPWILLMHGWMQIGRELRSVAEALAAAGYRVILPDLPGYGQSVLPYRSYPSDFYVQDAQMMGYFVDALGVQPLHVIGFSDGGEVALLMGILRPDLCKTVTSWGSIGAFPPGTCEAQRRNLPPKWITDHDRSLHPGQDVDLWPYQWADACCAIIDAGNDISVGQASKIQAPLLMILGDQDRLNPVSGGEKYIQNASKRRGIERKLEVFPGVGHAVHEAEPARFNQTIINFIGKYDK